MYRLQQNSVIRLEDGAYIPFADGNRDYEDYKQWVKDGGVPDPEFTVEELALQALAEVERLKDEAKKAGKGYTLNATKYIVPLDKDAQDTVTAITVAHIAGLFVSTTIEFSNGVKMPIASADWMAFAQWFVTERNAFFEVIP